VAIWSWRSISKLWTDAMMHNLAFLAGTIRVRSGAGLALIEPRLQGTQ
jgi:hypothetical protein